MTDPTFYQRLIAERTADVDPRHVEAWMRLEHPTLDGLSRRAFHDAVEGGPGLRQGRRSGRV